MQTIWINLILHKASTGTFMDMMSNRCCDKKKNYNKWQDFKEIDIFLKLLLKLLRQRFFLSLKIFAMDLLKSGYLFCSKVLMFLSFEYYCNICIYCKHMVITNATLYNKLIECFRFIKFVDRKSGGDMSILCHFAAIFELSCFQQIAFWCRGKKVGYWQFADIWRTPFLFQWMYSIQHII